MARTKLRDFFLPDVPVLFVVWLYARHKATNTEKYDNTKNHLRENDKSRSNNQKI